MATVTSGGKFLARILPAVVAEALVLGAAVLLFVYTGQIFWIFIAGAAGVAFAIWILILLNRHPHEWRYTNTRKP